MTALPPDVAAQCPDGTPPPCGRSAARPAAALPALDPYRIAVFPFRVSTADTLLGAGVAELLAGEFTGSGAPNAAHMGSVLRAWRQAGGSPARPLSQQELLRAARSLGAGLIVDGSIVGLGQRLTVSANIVTVATGRGRRVAPVSGSADSLEVLLRRVSASMLAITGGQASAMERGRLTDSPEAMREYLAGLSAYRRNDMAAASAAFERALGFDSLFAAAAFGRYRVANWQVAADAARWRDRVFALRERLSEQDRILLASLIGEQYPAPRLPARNLAERERAAQRLPDSPDALYSLGDYLYHYGGAAGAADRLERARALLERSLALDTQATVLQHLMEIAAFMADTALIRRLRPAHEALLPDNWPERWVAAARIGDEAWLATLRRRVSPLGVRIGLFRAGTFAVPAQHTDELAALLPASATVDDRRLVAVGHAFAAQIQGRPATAARSFAALPPTPPQEGADHVPVLLALFSDGDSAAGTAAAQRLQAHLAVVPDTLGAPMFRCAVALWAVLRGGVTLPDSPAARRRTQPNCAVMVELLEARRDGAPDLAARLAAADSTVRVNIGPGRYAGFENVVLAQLWEAAGEPVRALAATRLRPWGFGSPFTDAAGARLEGRLAAAVGDTTAAVRAFRRYLDLRKDAEPALIPQRDSVRAELAALERR